MPLRLNGRLVISATHTCRDLTVVNPDANSLQVDHKALSDRRDASLDSFGSDEVQAASLVVLAVQSPRVELGPIRVEREVFERGQSHSEGLFGQAQRQHG